MGTGLFHAHLARGEGEHEPGLSPLERELIEVVANDDRAGVAA